MFSLPACPAYTSREASRSDSDEPNMAQESRSLEAWKRRCRSTRATSRLSQSDQSWSWVALGDYCRALEPPVGAEPPLTTILEGFLPITPHRGITEAVITSFQEARQSRCA